MIFLSTKAGNTRLLDSARSVPFLLPNSAPRLFGWVLEKRSRSSGLYLIPQWHNTTYRTKADNDATQGAMEEHSRAEQ